MSVDFLCIFRSLLGAGERKDLRRKKGLLGKHVLQPPQQGCLGFLEPLLNKVWRGKGDPKLGIVSFGA